MNRNLRPSLSLKALNSDNDDIAVEGETDEEEADEKETDGEETDGEETDGEESDGEEGHEEGGIMLDELPDVYQLQDN
jgi:hypothetical protein